MPIDLRDHRARTSETYITSRPSTSVDRALDQAGRQRRVALALGAAEMREQQDLGPGVGQLEDRRRDRAGAGQVGHPPVGHRQVEVDAHQRDLAVDRADLVQRAKGRHHKILISSPTAIFAVLDHSAEEPPRQSASSPRAGPREAHPSARTGRIRR
jgi:hypothetical protein